MKTIAPGIWMALAAIAQAAAPELDCSETRISAAGLASHCEIRETALWLTGGTLTAKIAGSGSITASPWDEPGVQIRAQVLAGAQSQWQAEALAAQIEVDAGGGRVLVRGPRTDNWRTWSVNLEIRAPRTTVL